ncbi:MAG: TIGR01841 family phasin [Gammaproteobacteria bacterium]|nr:TIGR01841 family phasin [Gammaproteobacteria bacterium]
MTAAKTTSNQPFLDPLSQMSEITQTLFTDILNSQSQLFLNSIEQASAQSGELFSAGDPQTIFELQQSNMRDYQQQLSQYSTAITDCFAKAQSNYQNTFTSSLLATSLFEQPTPQTHTAEDVSPAQQPSTTKAPAKAASKKTAATKPAVSKPVVTKATAAKAVSKQTAVKEVVKAESSVKTSAPVPSKATDTKTQVAKPVTEKSASTTPAAVVAKTQPSVNAKANTATVKKSKPVTSEPTKSSTTKIN